MRHLARALDCLSIPLALLAAWFPCAPLGSAAYAASRQTLTVILDPGHGGEDTGAIRMFQGRRVTEKELTLKLARKTAQLLRAQGVQVGLTRAGDDAIPLSHRPLLANRLAKLGKKAVFVSIHTNSSRNASGSGVETYVFNATTNEASARLAEIENGHKFQLQRKTLDLILADLATTANYGESVQLACEVQRSVLGALSSGSRPAKDRGVRQALFYVLMQTQMPSILFETGFLSNPQELARLLTPSYQEKLARGLAEGILAWSRSMATGATLLSASLKAPGSRCAIR